MTTQAPARATVRRATTADLVELGELGAALAKIHHDYDPARFLYGEDFARGYAWWFGEELKNEGAYLAVIEREGAGRPASEVTRLLGYVYGRLEERDWNALLDEHAALVDVFVRDEARGGGLGKALVSAFCAWADERGAPRVVLSSASPNRRAQALFARMGFRPTMVEMTRERGDPGGAKTGG